MKIQSKSIAAALIIAGISLCSAKPAMAQKPVSQKTEVDARQSPHERNTKLIDEFLKTTDEKAAFNLLPPIKNGLTEELAATKRQILTAHQSDDTKAAKKAMQLNKQLAEVYNTVVQKSRSLDGFDKNAINNAFTKYLELKP